jgi:hypothetical protein
MVSSLVFLSGNRLLELWRKLVIKAKQYGIKNEYTHKSRPMSDEVLKENILELCAHGALNRVALGIIIPDLHDLLKRTDKTRLDNSLPKRVRELSDVFGLSSIEQEIVTFLFLTGCYQDVDHLYDKARDFIKVKSHTLAPKVVAMLTGLPLQAVAKELDNGSRLLKFKLLNSLGELEPEIVHYLSCASASPLCDKNYTVFNGRTRNLEQHIVAEDKVATIRELSAHHRAERSLNILLYGQPGTGKPALMVAA